MGDYFMDTETAGSLAFPLVYDIGGEGLNGSESMSNIVFETFFNQALMDTAYYSQKIPQYRDDMWEGERIVNNFFTIRAHIHELCKSQKITRIFAHNAAFDVRALNNTCRKLSRGKVKYFFPSNVDVCDTLKMARKILWKDENYWAYCLAHEGYMTKDRKPKPRLTAEIIYRYITNNEEFEEAHTGLADVKIEKEIYEYLYSKDPSVDCILYHAKA